MPEVFVPKKFCCKYTLVQGAHVVGVFFIVISAICTITFLVSLLSMDNSEMQKHLVWKNAYGFTVTGIVYSLVMMVMHGWMLWAVQMKKTSVLLAWVVVTALWLAQTTCMLMVMLLKYTSDVSFAPGMICLVAALIVIGILIYFILVVYGLWIELKREAKNNNPVAETRNK